MPKNIFTLFMLLTVFLLFSCREEDEAVKVSLNKRQEITFKLGILVKVGHRFRFKLDR